MSGRAWRGYLAVSAAAVAGYFLTPADTWMQTIYAELVGLAATGAIVLGVVKHRPAAKAAWLWFAAGQLLNVLGTLAEAVIGRLLHLETWPSAADVLWLGLYPALVIGLLVLIRHRTHGHDWGSLVDATTITTGLGLLSWVFLIRPVADDSSLSLVARMVSIAYPVGDILVLAMAIERARRDQVALSIALLDLDHFKRFNDEYGHQAGDRLLKSATAAWCTKLRAVDQLARYGGEEFIVLLPGAAAELATGVLERLRGVTPAGQTFSAGVAAWDGNETSNELIARADRALYQAKHAGRDRILVAAPQPQAVASPGPTAMTPHPSQATFGA